MRTPFSPTGRRSLRHRGFDYSAAGAYFVTTCTHNRLCLFGHIVEYEMAMNDAGLLIAHEWMALPQRFSATVDSFVVMPNHFHGILIKPEQGIPLGTLMKAFKSLTARKVNRLLCRRPASPLWQRGYHDRVIRSDRDLDTLRDYIALNPARWEHDRENPMGRPMVHENGSGGIGA